MSCLDRMKKAGRQEYRQPNIVFFDLETTGFDRPIRPVQIGAVGTDIFIPYCYFFLGGGWGRGEI